MGNTATIDWSKYSSPAASGNGQIDFSKYAGQAEPGAVDIPVIPSSTLAAPPSVMSQDPRAAVAHTLGREAQSLGQVFTGLPSAITSAVTTPITAEDKAKYGSTGNETLDKLGMGLTRMIAQPIEHAAEWYGNVAKGRVPNAYEQALSVAPEAMGQAAGNVVLGKAMESVPSSAVNAPRDINAAVPAFQRSSQHFEAFENAYGSRPATTEGINRLSAKAQKIADRMTENKAASVPGPVQTILDKASGGEQPMIAGMPAEEFQRRAPEAYQQMVDAGAIQPPQPMTILQMRHLHTDLNNLIYEGNLSDTFKGPIKDLARSVQNEIVNSLPNQTAKNWYLATNKEASRAYSAQRMADKIGPVVGGFLGYEAGRMAGQPLGGTVMGGMAGKMFGKAVIGRMAQSVLNRDIAPITPPPGAIESVMQAAKDGTISPGEAARRISNMGGSTKVQKPYWKADTYPDTGSQQ